MNEYREALRQYANFTGRASRRDYWMFFLFNVIFSTAAGIVDQILGFGHNGGGPVAGLYGLALIVPSLAIGTRRLHDTDRSGWWLLLSFIPIFGWIVLLVFLIQAGRPGANQYGPEPYSVGGYAPYGGAPYGGAPGGVPYSGAPTAGAPYGEASAPVPPVGPAPAAPPVPQVKVDGWQPDPTGRHELRYRAGDVWTEHVSDGGVTSVDPI